MVDQVITKQELINAKVDAKTLEDTVNGPPDIKVTSRLGRQYWTLATIDSKVASVVSQADYALVLIQNAQDQIIEIADTAQAQFDVKMADLEGQANSTINEWQAAINTIVVNDGVPALSVSTATGQNQQEINDFGGAEWRNKAGGYKLGATVALDNGDKVESTVDGNTNDPNVDMTWWVLINSDSQIKTWSGRTQEFENKRMSRTRLGQRILHENLPSSLDASGKFYPQGGCKVGNSLFLKIGNNIGTVGASTEQFIIVEYDFITGVKLSETAPMETLGHHELSGFIKNGKTYLVTSYQPASDILNRSGVGISLIEWKGASTTLANVQQFELLDSNQGVGYPAVDDAGEYIYISNKKWGASSGSGVLQYAPIFNVAVHKLSDVLQGKTFPNYSFNIEIPSGDGLVGSSSINGMTATLDHLYIVFGGAYGVTQIHKYSADGVLIEKIQTAIGRAARPQSEVVTENLFLYNTEPEGAFTSDGKIYLITAEEWYGAGEFVKFNNKFYMARYGMTNKSPASHADHWVKVPFTPTVWANYSSSTAYLGRNTSVGSFKRTIIEISLKTTSNYDLMMPDSVGEIPNMINNLDGQVHIYGCAQTSPRLTLGLYDYQRQTFQKNMSVGGREMRLFDAEVLEKLSDKYVRFASYQQDLQSRLALFPQSADTTTGFSLYGTDHQATAGVEFPYAAELLSKANRIVEFFKDGRLYVNSSNAAKIAFKLFVDGIEKFQVSGAADVTRLSTAEKVISFGQSIGGLYASTLLRLNFTDKAVTGNVDGDTYLGVRSNKWKQVNTKDLILQPSALLNPVDNGELVFEATSNTTVTIKLRGTDGVIRSVALTLA